VLRELCFRAGLGPGKGSGSARRYKRARERIALCGAFVAFNVPERNRLTRQTARGKPCAPELFAVKVEVSEKSGNVDGSCANPTGFRLTVITRGIHSHDAQRDRLRYKRSVHHPQAGGLKGIGQTVPRFDDIGQIRLKACAGLRCTLHMCPWCRALPRAMTRFSDCSSMKIARMEGAVVRVPWRGSNADAACAILESNVRSVRRGSRGMHEASPYAGGSIIRGSNIDGRLKTPDHELDAIGVEPATRPSAKRSRFDRCRLVAHCCSCRINGAQLSWCGYPGVVADHLRVVRLIQSL
jgi:hypothetical protein